MSHYIYHSFLFREETSGVFPFFPTDKPVLALPICSFKDLYTTFNGNEAVKFQTG